MSGFQFPPPPPPPPKPSQDNTGGSNSGGRGRGRGRGRGGHDGRGRGGRGSHGNNAGSRGFGPNAQQNSSYGSASNPPPGSFVNPAFHPQPPSTQTAATGGQSFNQLTNTNGYSPWGSNANGASGSRAAVSPSRTVAGHKRKLDALRGPQRESKQPGPPTAPSIPRFGNPIIPQQPPADVHRPSQAGRKRASNVLGLNPQNQDPQYSSDSDDHDDEADEEAMFAELGSNLTFEHDGKVLSLNTVAELAAWKEERSKNFPTKDRMIAREEKKRQIGEERKRLLLEAAKALRPKANHDNGRRQESRNVHSDTGAGSETRSQNAESIETEAGPPETELEKIRRQVADQAANLEALRQKVSEGEARLARASQKTQSFIPEINGPQSHGDAENAKDVQQSRPTAMEAGAEDEAGHNEVADAIVSSSSSSSSSAASSSDEESDDDGPPEEVTSRAPAKTQGTNQLVCKFFVASGHCRDGDTCAFKHESRHRNPGTGAPKERPPPCPRPAPATTGRKGIHDLLVEQEQNQENRLALQVIKHLGSLGFFAEATEATTHVE